MPQLTAQRMQDIKLESPLSNFSFSLNVRSGPDDREAARVGDPREPPLRTELTQALIACLQRITFVKTKQIPQYI